MSFPTVSLHSYDLESLRLTDALGHLLCIFFYRGECVCLPSVPWGEQEQCLLTSFYPISSHGLLLQKHKPSGLFFPEDSMRISQIHFMQPQR